MNTSLTSYELSILKRCKGRTFEKSVIFFLQMGVSSERAELILNDHNHVWSEAV